MRFRTHSLTHKNSEKEEESFSYHKDSDVEMSDYEHFIQRSLEKKERSRKLELRKPLGGKGKQVVGEKRLRRNLEQ